MDLVDLIRIIIIILINTKYKLINDDNIIKY